MPSKKIYNTDTGTHVLDILRSSILGDRKTLARSKKRKYHIFRQYYNKNVVHQIVQGGGSYLRNH